MAEAPKVAPQPKGGAAVTPATSDVPPLYMAIVSPDDPAAVMQVVALTPESTTSTSPTTFKRVEGKWIKDEQILRDLKSATPPPVVPLDNTVLDDVLKQVDKASPAVTASGLIPIFRLTDLDDIKEKEEVGEIDSLIASIWQHGNDALEEDDDYFSLLSNEEYAMLAAEGLLEDFSLQTGIADHAAEEACWDGYKQIGFKDKNGKHVPNCVKAKRSMTAAGGIDRNRGNAEKLRRYWTHGEGAAKIRWGTPGDWTRCVRHLSKYMGPRAKGYCQLRHKDALGFYTSTHAHIDKSRNFSTSEFDTGVVMPPTEVTQEDMQTPLDVILVMPDDLFDEDFTPEPEVENLLQDEACRKAMVAAGGLDRSRGDAEQLRRYWTVGKGAAKIRWGTPGDWTRCVRHLSKYLGVRSKGYCQLRHKEVTGVYTGSRLNPGNENSVEEVFSSRVVEQAFLTAQANAARARMSLSAGATPVSYGSQFSIPLVLPEEHESGDGRSFKAGAVVLREMPLPLMWQYKTGDGHTGSVVVGRIDHMERIDGGIGNAYGVFDNGPHGMEAERLVRNGFLRGISADLDQFEAKEDKPENSSVELGDEMGKTKLTISHARVMGVTIVPKPAFQECVIMLVDDEDKEEMPTKDGIYEETVEAPAEGAALVASGFLAEPIPVVPPTDWFKDPGLTKPTPLTIDDNGRVFGHVAAWNVNHIGLPNSTKPPRSRSKYAYFHTGVVRTDAGKDVPVGQLTLAGGHASLHASASQAAKHYDDTASAIADVHAGEDKHGIWVAGSLRPEATEAQIRQLRASAPSGDWRPIGGALELVAVCQVNVPGFPIARALMASGSVVALVAAGAYEMAMMRYDAAGKLSAKADALSALSASVETLSIRERIEAKRIDSEFGYISRDEREKLAEKGEALPDGSYPIRNVDDLKNAIQAYGRSKESDRAKVRKHIQKRASALKVRHMIPDEWKGLASKEATFAVDSMRARIAALTAAVPAPVDISDTDLKKLEDAKLAADAEREQVQAEIEARKEKSVLPDGTVPQGTDVTPKYDPNTGMTKYVPGKTQPRDAAGKFRKVLARLKQDLGVAGLQEALKQVEHTENLEFAGNYTQAAKSAQELLGTIDRLDSGALDATKLENVRTTAGELGKVIANLPLPFTNQAQKVRYSDLPPALKNLIDDMITRVGAKIGKKDADVATANLRSFKSGGDLFSQSEISSQMATLLRLLT
jgi:hypothetical protein